MEYLHHLVPAGDGVYFLQLDYFKVSGQIMVSWRLFRRAVEVPEKNEKERLEEGEDEFSGVDSEFKQVLG
ncbi:MAG: hypothetical protein ACOCQC_02605 [Halanaerobiaceae bacterium]